MDASAPAKVSSAPPEGGVLVITSGFCAACDSHFVNASAYRFEAADGTVHVEARHYADTATGPAVAERR